MSMRVLHVLSQRPSLTGSGITLDALVREARRAGWEQSVLAGVPAERPEARVGGLPPERIRALPFPSDELPFALPGMSDVMPYESSRFSSLDARQLEAYRRAWRRELAALRASVAPDVVHCHHVWLLAAEVRGVFSQTPLVLHGHGTDLRQMELCPHLAGEVKAAARRCEALVVLHEEHARRYGEVLGIEARRIHVVGSGYDAELFHCGSAGEERGARVMYAGKLSRAKGLPQLLAAGDVLAREIAGFELHIAGGGFGEEADEAREAMSQRPWVRYHGRLEQRELAARMRRCHAFVLPSFYEGLPLVLVEALASGCHLVATALPGIQSGLAPELGGFLRLVPAPGMEGIDRPREGDLPAFVEGLAGALRGVLGLPALGAGEIAGIVGEFSWRGVFRRVEGIWELLARA